MFSNSSSAGGGEREDPPRLDSTPTSIYKFISVFSFAVKLIK
jgi:hypothetical protein